MTAKPARLYDFAFSGNGYKVRLALAELGLPVAYEVIDILKGEAKSPDSWRRTPQARFPRSSSATARCCGSRTRSSTGWPRVRR